MQTHSTPAASHHDAERWQRVKSLLALVIDVPASERARILAEQCGDDVELRGEVESLLDTEQSDFLEQPAFAGAARALARARDALPAGERIGEFRIVRELGRGGMGTVYLAEEDGGEYRRQVALKVVRRDRNSELVFRRFRQERQILAGLDHPNIARLFSGGTTAEGLPYFVMEYVQGEPIDAYCEQRVLSRPQRLELFRNVCSAVHYAHQHLVVHRDIKPANVLVTADGVPKLLDFGIAKVLDDAAHAATAERRQTSGAPSEATLRATPAGSTTLHAMTPDYASPEQRARTAVTTLSDVWSLGVLLYELLTGVHPRIDVEPVRPSSAARANGRAILGDLDNIVLMAMRLEPQRRYASAAALSEDIRRHLTGMPVMARPDTVGYRAAKFVQRNRAFVAAGMLMVLSLVGGIVGTTWQMRSARVERLRAERRFDEVRQLATSFLFELDAQIAPLSGAVPARESLVRRALLALDGLAREARSSDADASLLRDLAVAYQRVGDVQGKPYAANLGHTESALQSYRKAVAILEGIRRARPSDIGVQRDLARALQAASAVQARTGDVDGAIVTQRRAVALCESVLLLNGADTAAQSQLSDNLLWLGRALYQKNALVTTWEALAIYERALVIRTRLSDATPRDPMRRYRVAVSNSFEGYALWRIGDLTGDTTFLRSALGRLAATNAVTTSIGKEMPPSVDMRRASVDVLHEMAMLNVQLGDGAAALRQLRQALPTTTTLADADRRNAEAQRDLAATQLSFARAYTSLADSKRAELYARRARTIVERLHDLDPSNTDDIENLSRIAATIGEARRAVGDLPAAVVRYDEARAIARRFAQSAPTSDGPRRLLASHDASLAELHVLLAARTANRTQRARHAALACDAGREAMTQWTALKATRTLARADSLAAVRADFVLQRCAVPRG